MTLVVPLPKKPLTKFATAASSSALWPRANGGMKACSTGSGALEPASRIAVRLGVEWLPAGADLVLRFGLEIAGVMALVQLFFRRPAGAVDHSPALDGRAHADFFRPACQVFIASVGRISRRRNPPTAVPEQPSGGLRFANPPYALNMRVAG